MKPEHSNGAPTAGDVPRKRAPQLPDNLPPRGLTRLQAAAYVGIGAALFDRAVKDGRMPRPFRLYGRTLWDVRKLDAAIDALDTEAEADDPCSRLAL
jgi:predicted DNA-binding transcriptional regulator AlpA